MMIETIINEAISNLKLIEADSLPMYFGPMDLWSGDEATGFRFDFVYHRNPISIVEWEWFGEPNSQIAAGIGCVADYQIKYKDFYEKIDNIIRLYKLEECITSPSIYIRECKKYYESRTR